MVLVTARQECNFNICLSSHSRKLALHPVHIPIPAKDIAILAIVTIIE